MRLAIGWTVVVLAVLGLLHVVNGADKIVADVDAMSQAGGWFGAIIGEPLRSTLSWAGALVVLFAIGLAGAMLVTDTTVPELVTLVRTWSNKAGGKAATAARTATTNRDRGSYDDLVEVPGEENLPPRSKQKKPSIYDAADDEDLAPEKPKPSRKPLSLIHI